MDAEHGIDEARLVENFYYLATQTLTAIFETNTNVHSVPKRQKNTIFAHRKIDIKLEDTYITAT